MRSIKEKVFRLIILFGGLVTAHLGVTLFLLSDLGADPFNVLIQGLHLLLGAAGLSISHGTVHMGVCFLIILVLLAVDRHYIQAGTIVCMLCGGPIIDFFTWALQPLMIGSTGLPVRIPVLVLGCVILAFGMTIVIRSEAGTGPNDLVALVISEKAGFRFGITRTVTDAVFVLAGWLLGGTAGIGTVICAFLVGFVADFFMPFSGRLVENMLRCMQKNHRG